MALSCVLASASPSPRSSHCAPPLHPQIGDLVQFRVGANVEGQNFKAVRIKILEREPVVLATAPVETVKDKFGFISYVPEGSNEANLFFHFTNIVDDSIPAKNDIVSFEVGRNPKNAKYQAINVKMVKCVSAEPGAHTVACRAAQPASQDAPFTPTFFSFLPHAENTSALPFVPLSCRPRHGRAQRLRHCPESSDSHRCPTA